MRSFFDWFGSWESGPKYIPYSGNYPAYSNHNNLPDVVVSQNFKCVLKQPTAKQMISLRLKRQKSNQENDQHKIHNLEMWSIDVMEINQNFMPQLRINKAANSLESDTNTLIFTQISIKLRVWIKGRELLKEKPQAQNGIACAKPVIPNLDLRPDIGLYTSQKYNLNQFTMF